MSNKKRTFRQERLKNIYEYIQENNKAFVPELAEHFGISESSIRLDLTELESHNLITRTHGGALRKTENKSNLIFDLDEIQDRLKHLEEEKHAIARKTASIIEDGDTIMMDGGSTTKILAKYLENKKNLTIITNSLILIPDFISNPNINFYVLGGLAYKEHGVVVGYMTDDCIAQFHPNKAILGIDGISLEKGLTAANPSNPAVSSVKTKMIEVSDQIIIVGDHSKFNRICLMPVAPIEAVDIFVTDKGTPNELIEEIRRKGPRVLVA